MEVGPVITNGWQRITGWGSFETGMAVIYKIMYTFDYEHMFVWAQIDYGSDYDPYLEWFTEYVLIIY